MLDELLKLAAEQIGITSAEIDRWRSKLEHELEENPGSHHQPIRQRQLGNPTRSSTPIDQQITKSEQRYWKMWEAARPQLKQVVPVLLALTEQKLRTEHLTTARKRQRDQTLTDAGMKPGYIKLCDRLQQNGATHTKAAQLKDDEMALFADLIRWKEHDPRNRDQDNPWPAIRAIYAERTLLKVSADGLIKRRSWPGRPPAQRHTPTPMGYWRFGPDADASLESAGVVAPKPVLDNKSDQIVPDPIPDMRTNVEQESQQFATIFDELYARHNRENIAAPASEEQLAKAEPAISEPVSRAKPGLDDEPIDQSVHAGVDPTPPAPSRPVRPPAHRGGGFGDLIRRPARNDGPDGE